MTGVRRLLKPVFLLVRRDFLGECLGHVQPAAIDEVGEWGFRTRIRFARFRCRRGRATNQDRRLLPVAACRPL